MDELTGRAQRDDDPEMERRRAEMHRRIMAARRAVLNPDPDGGAQPDPGPPANAW